VADKLMVTAALLVLLYLGRVDVMIAFVIIGREITISALREWMAKIGASASVAVHWLGKFKTAAQMVAITCLLYHSDFMGIPVALIGQVLILIAAILTVWSMLYYLRRAMPVIREKPTRYFSSSFSLASLFIVAHCERLRVLACPAWPARG